MHPAAEWLLLNVAPTVALGYIRLLHRTMTIDARGRALAAFAAVALVCLTAVVLWARPDRVFARLGQAEGGVGLRSEIWRESARVAARYPIAGVGAGAFPAAMTVYQTRRDVFYNHAHNQYLEIAAEGGLLVSIPLLGFIAGIAGSAATAPGALEVTCASPINSSSACPVSHQAGQPRPARSSSNASASSGMMTKVVSGIAMMFASAP